MTAGDRLIILILNIRQFYEYFLTPLTRGNLQSNKPLEIKTLHTSKTHIRMRRKQDRSVSMYNTRIVSYLL